MRFLPAISAFGYRAMLCAVLWFSAKCSAMILWADNWHPPITYLLPLLLVSIALVKAYPRPFWGWIPLTFLLSVNLCSLLAIWYYEPCHELGLWGAICLSLYTVSTAIFSVLCGWLRWGWQVWVSCLFLAGALLFLWYFAAMSADDWTFIH